MDHGMVLGIAEHINHVYVGQESAWSRNMVSLFVSCVDVLMAWESIAGDGLGVGLGIRRCP
uniref:Uncharacterized protein OJ1080_F08.109 n=2 Tax=Oryza sativa subsp. japonica TaxID=39947 RepID=Q8GSK3_ORYSJ|nr:unknown protein [Oryza sativa Japonica Group]BAC20015.1 unknown protein [Oryza sativa Japonica Group]